MPDVHLKAFEHLLSLERLVKDVKGLRTRMVYYETKHMALNRNTDWQPVIDCMTDSAVLARIQWCEVFLSDMVIIRRRSDEFEKRMAQKGADTQNTLGSREHEEQKLRTLLRLGESAVAAQDACEDVLLRGVRRLMTLVNWAYEVIVFVVCRRVRLSPRSPTAVASAC